MQRLLPQAGVLLQVLRSSVWLLSEPALARLGVDPTSDTMKFAAVSTTPPIIRPSASNVKAVAIRTCVTGPLRQSQRLLV